MTVNSTNTQYQSEQNDTYCSITSMTRKMSYYTDEGTEVPKRLGLFTQISAETKLFFYYVIIWMRCTAFSNILTIFNKQDTSTVL